MSEDRRVALIEAAFEAFNASDVPGILWFLDPDVESAVVSPLMNAGTWRGLEGFGQMAAGWNEVWGEINYELRGHELVDDANVLVSVRQTAKGIESGVPVELEVIYLLEFRGDKAVRFQVHPDRDSALAAL